MIPAITAPAYPCGHPARYRTALVLATCCLTAWAAAADEIVVEVSGEPAADYRTDEPIAANDAELAGELASRTTGLTFSSRLAHAARLYAAAADPANQESLPEELLEFVLHTAGCVDVRATGALVYTTEDDGAEMWDHLRRLLAAAPERTHVGISRVTHVGGRFRWRWAILLTTRQLQLRPVATRGQAGEELTVSFALADGLRQPQVMTQPPGGAPHDAPLVSSEGWWSATVRLGPGSGAQIVEILAEGPYGPTVLALFPVAVGDPPPREWRGERRGQPALPDDPVAAAHAMATLVNEERRRSGLPALAWDDSLATVARRHSQDMEASGFLGHSSPTAGDLRARLRSRGIMVYFAAENLSNSASVATSHASLMRSPGHRRNVLSSEATHMGIGVVVQEKHGRKSLLITQIFARPAQLVPRPPS